MTTDKAYLYTDPMYMPKHIAKALKRDRMFGQPATPHFKKHLVEGEPLPEIDKPTKQKPPRSKRSLD
jgi:hypothetical protein